MASNKGPFPRSQRRNATARQDDSGMMMVAPKLSSGADLSLEVTSPYLSSSYNNRTDLRAITDKISKALEDFDQLYTDDAQEDLLLMDVTHHVDMLESGELKYQLKNFINKYKDMSSVIEEANNERDEILNSLSDWFTEDHLDMNIKLSFDENAEEQSDNSVREGLMNAKLGFEKLKALNKEIMDQAARGRDTRDLERERKKLQKNVIEKFKEYKKNANENKQAEVDAGTAHTEKAWKHAADEICGLLKKVRDEGTGYVAELESKINAMIANLDKNEKHIQKLEAEVKDKKYLVKKWEQDNLLMTKDKAKLEARLVKLKKELKIMRKALSRYEVVPKSKFEAEEEEEKGTAANLTMPSGSSGSGDPMILKAQLQDAKNQINTLTEQNRELIEKLDALEEACKEKEEDIEKLANDKAELVLQMKQASIRPDMRHLSQTSAKTSFGGSVTGMSIKATSEEIGKDQCQKCGCHKALKRSSPSITVTKSITSSSSISKTSSITVAIQLKEEEMEALHKKNQEAQKTISNLEKQLLKANQEITVLKSNRPVTSAPYPTPVATAEVTSVSKEQLVKPQQAFVEAVEPNNTSQRLVVNYGEPEIAESSTRDNTVKMPAPIVVRKDKAESITQVEEVWTKPTRPAQAQQVDTAEVQLYSRGMQTDPKMDPLSAWSQVITFDSGWRPPMPPSKWVNYDPTRANVGRDQQSLGTSMLKGAEPAEIRQNTINVSNLVHRELDRMIQGVMGFAEYLNTMVDRETREMASANGELRKCLSTAELLQLEQDLQRPPSDLHGDRSSTDLSIPVSKLDLEPPPVSPRDHAGAVRKSARRLGQLAVETKQAVEMANLMTLQDSLLPVEERVKGHINRIAQEAVAMLRRTYDLIYNSLQNEHRQYEYIYTTMLKQGPDNFPGKQVSKEPGDGDSGMQPQVKRSRSHNDLLLMGDYEDMTELSMYGTGGTGMKLQGSKNNLYPRKSRSNSNIFHDSHMHFQPSSLFMTLQQREKASEMRKKLLVSTATIPKKGLIKLTTPGSDNTDGDQYSLAVESQLRLGGKDTQARKKTKPAPMSHQKLLAKQNKLLNKTGVEPKPRERRGSIMPVRQNAAMATDQSGTTYELPEDYFGGYTLLDFEQKVEQFAETQTKAERHNMLNMLGDKPLPNLKQDVRKANPLPPIDSKPEPAENRTMPMRL